MRVPHRDDHAADRAPHGVVLVALAVISGCSLGGSDGALRDRGLSRRLAIVISFVALDAALAALAFEPPLGPMFIVRAAVVSLNGLAALVLVAQLTGLSPTDGEGGQNRWATDPGRHKVGVKDY